MALQTKPFDPYAAMSREDLIEFCQETLMEVKALRSALEAIERFGHGGGHGRGYTCANMAAEALRASDGNPEGGDSATGSVAKP